jgi:hypothetical protein
MAIIQEIHSKKNKIEFQGKKEKENTCREGGDLR